MSRELINLLPPEREQKFRREYFVRLGVTGVVLLALLVVIHGVLLLPSYLYLSTERAAKEQERADLNAQLGNTVEAALGARLSALKADAHYLSTLGSVPTASAAIRGVLQVPRPGIRITSITFAPSTAGAANGKMTVSGVAATRETLRAYDLALSSAPFISSANLPISAYAKETDIDFTVTLIGTLTP